MLRYFQIIHIQFWAIHIKTDVIIVSKGSLRVFKSITLNKYIDNKSESWGKPYTFIIFFWGQRCAESLDFHSVLGHTDIESESSGSTI